MKQANSEKQVSIEEIYMELECIFDNVFSPYDRMLAVYGKLHELLLRWEGYERMLQKVEAERNPAN